MSNIEQENPLPSAGPDTEEKDNSDTIEVQPAERPHSFDEIDHEHDEEGRHFLGVAVILIALCAVGFGVLIWSQNITLVSLSDSMASVSDIVNNLAQRRTAEILATGETVVKTANVATDNCEEQGGQLAVAKRPDGTAYGLCLFGTDRQCEEWALLDGKCPAGGIEITQFGHPADVYCAVTGNEVIGTLIPGKAGKCRVGTVVCTSESFYQTGECLSVLE